MFLLILIEDTHCVLSVLAFAVWKPCSMAHRATHTALILKLSASLDVRFLSRKRVRLAIPNTVVLQLHESGCWRSDVELEALSLCPCAVYFTHKDLSSSLEACDVISIVLYTCLFSVALDLERRSSALVHTSIVVTTGCVPMVHVGPLILIIRELCQTIQEYLPFSSLSLRFCSVSFTAVCILDNNSSTVRFKQQFSHSCSTEHSSCAPMMHVGHLILSKILQFWDRFPCCLITPCYLITSCSVRSAADKKAYLVYWLETSIFSDLCTVRLII